MAQSPYIVSLTVTQPNAQVSTGSVDVLASLGDSIGPLTIEIPGYTLGIEAMNALAPAGHYRYIGTGIPAGATYTAYVLDASPAKLPGDNRDFTIDPAPTGAPGCTTPRALNYDPNAGFDPTPSLCEFVQVPQLPRLVAAHLPIPLMVRASPTVAGLASIVRLILATSTSLSGPWVEFGRLAQVCDDTATAMFNLSESAKALLINIPPPVESGPEVGLSALLRVSYEVLDPETLQPNYAGVVGITRALNAVVSPAASGYFTSPSPYTALPTGAALWRSDATYADGIVSSLVTLPSNGCNARQFVWLNGAGAWDTGYFYGRHQHGTDQQDPISYRDAAGADRYAKRGTVRDTLQVYSDKLNWATYQLLRGVRKSIQVYERLGPKQYVPVLVSAESYPEYQEQTDKEFEVNFTVSYPAQLIQTQ
jgi:hypothetical protein